MKTIQSIVLLFILLFSSSVSAQNIAMNTETTAFSKEVKNSTSNTISEKSEIRAFEAYYRGLFHESNGIVEASIYNIISMRLESPDQDYSSHIKRLSELMNEGETERIQLMAFIGKTYMENTYLYLNVKHLFLGERLESDRYDEFFKELMTAMQNEYLDERVKY